MLWAKLLITLCECIFLRGRSHQFDLGSTLCLLHVRWVLQKQGVNSQLFLRRRDGFNKRCRRSGRRESCFTHYIRLQTLRARSTFGTCPRQQNIIRMNPSERMLDVVVSLLLLPCAPRYQRETLRAAAEQRELGPDSRIILPPSHPMKCET